MFEGAVAGLLNRLLGKYVQDLDTEHLNVGVFSGSVNLTDLKLKPEALYELDLPIDVKIGTIGRVNLQIPWGALYTQPVLVNVEDVLVLVGPAVNNSHYDPEREKRLTRAAKRKILQDLEAESQIVTGPQNFFEHLFTAIVNNLQIYVRNIHIRYEDSISSRSGPVACGLCLQSLSIETTNSKWKPSVTPVNASSVYQLMRVESLSFYWNPRATVLDAAETADITPMQYYNWKHYMITGLDKFAMHQEDFDFLLKPTTCKVKVIMSRSEDTRAPRLLVDAVLQDSALQLSRAQRRSMREICSSFKALERARKYRHLHPGVPLRKDARRWWRYACNAVIEHRVRPHTWAAIKRHRQNYVKYKQTYKSVLRSPNDTELKLDLQQCEDSLPIVSIVIAREHAKIELLNQDPPIIEVVESEYDWWYPQSPSLSPSTKSPPRVQFCVKTERSRSLWSHLSSPEKKRVCELIGYVEGGRPDKPKQYIEHKINLTLANCSLSLTNRGKEVMVVTLTQFLTSLETRPSAKAYKLSARTESIVIEGVGLDGELAPLLAPTANGSSTTSNLLSLDYEKNPMGCEADYSLGLAVEPADVTYNEHAITELINMFHTGPELSRDIHRAATRVAIVGRAGLARAAARRTLVHVHALWRGTRVLLPDSGGKTSKLLIVDIERVLIRSELQPGAPALEDATCMELEERLYDRLHAECALQVLFCEVGAPWRDASKLPDSELHLIPKMKAQVVFSNSIKKDYKLLPGYKMNVSLSSLKLNLSDLTICQFLDFMDNLHLPSPNTVPADCIINGDDDEETMEHPGRKQLRELTRSIHQKHLPKNRHSAPPLSAATARFSLERMASASFDAASEFESIYSHENVSPANKTKTLLRLLIGEIVINLSRSTPDSTRPYLAFSLQKLCIDISLLDYGPAIQLSVQSASLVDKQHLNSTGLYLEVFSCENNENGLLNLSYRKVRADCPDFRSHFHSVERSLVAEVGDASLTLHAGAAKDAHRYLQYLFDKIQARHAVNLKSVMAPKTKTLWNLLMKPQDDPPVPPGTTKFSYMLRISSLKLCLWHLDQAVLQLQALGAESELVFRADDRFQLKILIMALRADDPTPGSTLYPALIWPDEDKVFEMKYVRSTPKFYSEQQPENVKANGELRVYLGRLHVVLYCSVIQHLLAFLEPLVPGSVAKDAMESAQHEVLRQVDCISSNSVRLHLAIEIHAPILLLPPKPTSPSLLVLNMGDLTVENFFKRVKLGADSTSPSQDPIIDNILVKLDNVTMTRAVMTLTANMEVQEPILDPFSIRLDVKRLVCPWKAVRDLPRLACSCSAEAPSIQLARRDLAALCRLREDLAKGFHTGNLVVDTVDDVPSSETTVHKLEEFFAQGEPIRKEVTFRFTLEGLEIKLFSDMDEVLSSPVRDMNHALAKLTAGEVQMNLDSFSDKSVEITATLQSLSLEDISVGQNAPVRKIFESLSADTRSPHGFCVQRPPLVDLGARRGACGGARGAGGAWGVDVRVDRSRTNLAPAFLLQVARTLLDAMPGDRSLEGGVVNHGYVGDTLPRPERSTHPSDPASGYYSNVPLPDESPGLSISIQFRQPEIMFFAEQSKSGHALLLRTELLIDYSSHSNTDNLVISLASLQIISRLQSKLTKIPPQMVLRPCDIEFSRSFKNAEEGVKINLSLSEVDLDLTPSTVHTVMDIFEEVSTELSIPEEREPFQFTTFTKAESDLWSPKKVSCICCPIVEEILPPSGPGGCGSFVLKCGGFKARMKGGERGLALLQAEMQLELTLYDWSKQLHGSGRLAIQADVFDCSLRRWQPLLERVTVDENMSAMWALNATIFQSKSYPMSTKLDSTQQPVDTVIDSVADTPKKSRTKSGFESETSADEVDSDNEMVFIRSSNANTNKSYNPDAVGVFLEPTDGEDSDSDNENGLMDKLAAAIGHLFTNDSSGEEQSNDESSAAESDAEEEIPDGEKLESFIDTPGKRSKKVTLQAPEREDSIDSGLDTDSFDERPCTYLLLDSAQPLNFTISGECAKSIFALIDSIEKRGAGVPVVSGEGGLRNDIGPGSRVQLISRREADLAGRARVVATADYLLDTSRPSTPGGDTSSADMLDDAEFEKPTAVVEEEDEWECFEDAFSSTNSPGATSSLSPRSPLSAPTLYSDVTAERLRIQLADFDELTVLCPQRSFQRLHVLHPSRNGARYYVAVERTAALEERCVTVRSPLQICNETCYALELYYKKTDLQAIGVDLVGSLTNPFDDKMRLCTIQPDDTYNVPLYIAYHCHLYLLSANFESYQTTSQGIWWADLAKDPGCARDVTCPAKDPGDSRIFAMRVLTVEGIQSPKVTRSIPNYLIRLVPPLTIYNRLPYALEVSAPALQYTARIEPGGKTYCYTVDLSKTWRFAVDVNYMGLPWNGGFNLSPELTDKNISMVTECETEGGNKQLCACVKADRAEGCALYIYAPYWIINKTGLPMQMKSTRSDTIYELTEEPVLWSGRRRAAPRVRLRAHQSGWTRAARLVPSAPGLLDCTHRERRMHYRQLMQVTLSELCPQLTKIVTILPFFLVYNETRRPLRYMEEDEAADLWLELPPAHCAAWWPRTTSMRMRCRLRDSATASQHFPVAEQHRTVLRMDKGSAITVEVSGGTDSPFTITFKPYVPGDAPVRVDNLCEDLFLKLQQTGSGQATLLSPSQSVLYTWDEPARPRELRWAPYNNRGEGRVADFSTDGYGEVKVSFHSIKHPTLIATNSVTSKLSSTFKRLTPKSPEPCDSSSEDSDSEMPETPKNKKIRKDKVMVYWVSFMDGYQRVFALTQDERIAYQYRKRINSERSNFEIYLSLSTISLSACIQTKSGMKELAYISMTDSLPRWEVNVSHKWKQLTPDLTTWIEDKYKTDQKKCQLKEYLHIDLEKMQMTKPFFSELRRTYSPGVWLQYRRSETFTYAHIKVHRFQVDNQLNEAVFPSVFYPVAGTVKPSLELVMLKQYRPVQNQDVYKYFKVMVQQHSLNLDRGFVNHVFDILNQWKVEGKPAVRLRADLALVHMPLPVIAMKNQVSSQRNVVFEFVHLSPIRIVLSLSSRGYMEANRSDFASKDNRPKLFNSDLLEYLFNSWGSFLCDMKDVNIKMSHLEFRDAPITLSTLLDLASRHYWSQLLQQAHVFVLGLDILGNPWANRDVANQRTSHALSPGHHDIASKLAAGAARLLGHCAGTVRRTAVFADAPSRDSSVNKPDHLEKINDIPEELLEMSRSNPSSIALALSGLIARPTFDEDAMFIAHASREAALCRQLGAGTEAAVRASIERASSRIIARRRLPRHCGDIEGLRPYSLHAALGAALLSASAPRTEHYVAHAPLTARGTHLLLTTRHIYLVRGGAGAWRTEWAVRLDDLIGVPEIDGDKIVLTIKQDELTSYFSTDEKVLEVGGTERAAWLRARIECALIANMADKRCPPDL